MTAYYNEKDEFAAQWLRNLIAANMIAPGDVDERDIQDVTPLELHKYTQCHLFAGIGVWSYSMRRAGWPDNRRAWSGSCPCQPFSQAGEGAGFADERHLWPAFFHLIEQCGPEIVFGEQVASKDGLAWLDLVQSDMEAANYAFGAVDTCAAGFGAPHIRQRLYWVAYCHVAGLERRHERRNGSEQWPFGAGSMVSGLANDAEPGRFPWGRGGVASDGGEASRLQSGRLCNAGGLADVPGNGRGQIDPHGFRSNGGAGQEGQPAGLAVRGSNNRPGPVNGAWDAVDWLRCKDERWRPVEPGTFPLVNGAPNRVGLLRGYGNAIVAPQAEEFIRVAMEYAP